MMSPADRLQRAVEAVGDGLLLVVTGAGVSRASGIPTFRGRDPGAVWRVSDVELATRDYFERDPVTQWSWYLERFASLERAAPNPAHHALAALERWQTARGGDYLLVTQNIDTLHEAAGSRRMIKVHGSSDRLRCSRYGCPNGAPRGSLARSAIELEPFRRRPVLDALPRCPRCDSLLRAHVLFFDELYDEHSDYRFAEVERAAARAAVLLFAGTSFAVGVTDLLLQTGAARKVPMLAVDPVSGRQPRWSAVEALPAAAELLLPELCDRLGAELPRSAAGG